MTTTNARFAMRFGNVIRIFGVIIVLWPTLGEARRIQSRGLPEEFESKASLICNGTVISVEETDSQSDFHYPEVAPSWHSEEVMMLAKIKVLHIFKGQAAAVIEFRYRVLVPSTKTTVISNEPEHVALQKGGRYRFFLKPGGRPGGYVGVLDGKYDDNSAVETLASTETDDNPYLKKEEAIKFAVDYVRSNKSAEEFDLSRGFVECWPEVDGGATWFVMLYDIGSTSVTYSQVFLFADRTINEQITKLNEGHGN